MSYNSPGEVVREFYRRAGEIRERNKWITAVAALRESLNEMAANNPAEYTQHFIDIARTTLDSLERLANE